MTRNLKMLGVAFAAVLALSAIGASMASAQTQFHTTVIPQTLSGVQGATPDKFTTTAGSAECKTVSYTGSVIEKTVTTVKVAPTYSNCTVLGIAGAIATNGCEYLFHIDPTNINVTTGTVDIVCPAGKEITLTAGGGTTGLTDKCTVHVPAQTGLGTVTFSNSAPKVHVAVNISGIKYSHTEGSGVGKCVNGSGTTGTYVGTGLVSGTSGGEIFVG